MKDIVTRLREATVPRLEMGWPAPHVVQRKEPLWLEAADEIERLRVKIDTVKRQRNKARRAAALLGWKGVDSLGLHRMPKGDATQKEGVARE